MAGTSVSDITNTDYETYETYSIGSDEKEYFMDRDEIIDSDDESDVSFYSEISGSDYEFDECQINDDILFPELIVPCRGQRMIDGQKCFKNTCIPVKKIISQSLTESYQGNVVEIESPSGRSMILKWNRQKQHLESMMRELRIQNIAYSIGLAPKIYDWYYQPVSIYRVDNQIKRDGYLFIFMENLLEKGYKSVHDIYAKYKRNGDFIGFKRIPQKILLKIAQAIYRLNYNNIAHRDAHPKNVFYNQEKNSVKIIDFGHSRIYSDVRQAFAKERLGFFDTSETFQKHNIPDQWKDIRDIVRKKLSRVQY